ncbi:acyl-CoA desaturase [Aliidiomarina quisquiliarum]|uniref:acyl-CoA desaturase n=1 Tax=Aliidiomarina quisquiliarum TaxID=2938947 RepID=UPI00208F97A6|nr:fatty acid desaturase [Aliidiomarina quisquiliarum]MCO4322385.1 fatty acid desaturase [Aliidiomarina quisquiliarum]
MKKPALLWLNISVFSVTFLVAAIGTPLYIAMHGLSTGLVVAFFALFIWSGLSITGGYHRLWSHRTYDAHPIIRVIYALGGALSLQNSVLHWASDHREHHKHVDHIDHDPYSITRGFWFAHIGWMLREYHAHRYNDYSNVRDLQQDPIIAWQHKHYLVLTLLMNIGLPLVIGVMLGQIWGALLFAGFLRLVVSHHTTFFINSLAHIWGKRPYTERNSARDNGLLAFLTFGEGYHNFHHIFAGDYRNGIRWYQFDPTKWLIASMAWFGLARNLKRTNKYQVEKARLEMLWLKSQEKRPSFTERLEQEYENLMVSLRELNSRRRAWANAKRDALQDMAQVKELKAQYKSLKRSFREQKRNFRRQLLTT